MAAGEQTGLPTVAVEEETYAFPDGQEIAIHSVSRAQAQAAIKAAEKGDVDQFEILIIAGATGLKRDQVTKWYADTPSGVVQGLLEAITRISGLDEESGKGTSAP
jgi:hypothetical protein